MTIENEALTIEFVITKAVPYSLEVDTITAGIKTFTFDIFGKREDIADVLAATDTIYGYYGSGNAATTFTVAAGGVTETARTLTVVVDEAVAQDYHTIKWTKDRLQTVSLVKEKIRSVTLDADHGRILLSLQSGDNDYGLDEMQIIYANVTSPVTANITQLYELIKLYIETQAMLSSIRSDTTDAFNLTGGPYQITFDVPLGTADYTVIAGDENDGALKVDVSSIAITGFQFDCLPIPPNTTAIVHYHCIVKTES